MNIEEYRDFCLSFPNAEESMPFGDNVIVFKVGGKMFTLASLFPFTSFMVKCDPEQAIILRMEHPEVTGAYHMNKKHWNSISCEGSLSETFIKTQIFNSYNLVSKVPISYYSLP